MLSNLPSGDDRDSRQYLQAELQLNQEPRFYWSEDNAKAHAACNYTIEKDLYEKCFSDEEFQCLDGKYSFTTTDPLSSETPSTFDFIRNLTSQTEGKTETTTKETGTSISSTAKEDQLTADTTTGFSTITTTEVPSTTATAIPSDKTNEVPSTTTTAISSDTTTEVPSTTTTIIPSDTTTEVPSSTATAVPSNTTTVGLSTTTTAISSDKTTEVPSTTTTIIPQDTTTEVPSSTTTAIPSTTTTTILSETTTEVPSTTTTAVLSTTTTMVPSTTSGGVPCEEDDDCGRCRTKDFTDKDFKNSCPELLEVGASCQNECPDNLKGNKIYTCKKGGNLLVANSCLSEWIHDLLEEIKNETKDVTSIAKELSSVLENKTLTEEGDKIITILDAVDDLVNLAIKQFGKFNDTAVKAKNFSEDLIASLSTIVGKNKAWDQMETNDQKKGSSKIIHNTEKVAWFYASKRNTTFNQEDPIKKTNIEMQPQFFLKAEWAGGLEYPQYNRGRNTSIRIELEKSSIARLNCSDGCSGIGTLYDGIGHRMKRNTKTVNSEIIGFALDPSTKVFPNIDVYVRLEHLNKEMKNPVCVFWNFSELEWNTEGCSLEAFDEHFTLCRCSHLTNFAVLMDMEGNLANEDVYILDILSTVCLVLSVVSLILTICCLTCFRSLRCRKSTITCNVCVCLLFADLIILVFFRKMDMNSALCNTVKGFLLFSLLSAFMWMLLEGFHLYRMIVLVFNHTHIRTLWFYASGYGLPAVFTVIAVVLTKDVKRKDTMCWFQDYGIFYFCGPIAVVILINIIILVMSFVSASRVKIKTQQSSTERIVSWLKGSASLVCLLGINWIIGFPLLSTQIQKYIMYPFTIINGLQGLLIFIFHVIWNENARSVIMRTFKAKFSEHPYSSQTNSNSRRRMIGVNLGMGIRSLSSSTKSNHSSTKSTRASTTSSTRSRQSRDITF